MVWMSMFTNNLAPRNTNHLLSIQPKAKSERNGPKDRNLPEYVAYVARKSLLSFTTSLTKVSSQAHDFFAHVNSYLALERMMRNCFGWMMPSVTSPLQLPISMATQSVPQIWAAPNWFAFMPQTLSKPEPRAAAFPINDNFTIYGTMMAFSAALFSLAPTTMQAWGMPV
jgi:hypothetical protein